MAFLKVYSYADGELFIDFAKQSDVKKKSMILIPLEPGQYFVRLSTKNPLLFKEDIINVAGDSVFQAKKEDFLSNLTTTQLNSLQIVRKQLGKTQWLEELYSGLCISNEYTKIGEFHDGICAVWTNGHCGLINRLGEEIVPCKFEDFGETKGGLSTVQFNEKWGAVNSFGEFIIQPHYDYCCSNGDYWDVSKGGNWEYEEVGYYEYYNYHSIYRGGKWGLCDSYGREIVPCRFANSLRIDGDYFIGNNSCFKLNGEELFSDIVFEVLRTIPSNHSLFFIKQNGKWGIIWFNGRFVCSPQFDEVDDFNNGLCPVKKNEKWGVVNDAGVFIQQCVFDRIKRDSTTGNYFAIIDKKTGVLDRNANYVLRCQYDSVSIEGSFFIVSKSNQYGVVDKWGTLVILLEYDLINRQEDNRFFVCKKNDLYGVFDYTGRQIVPISYSSIIGPKDNSFIVEDKKKFGLLSIDGRLITSIVYDAIVFRSGLGFCFKLNGLWGVMNGWGRVIFQSKYYFIGSSGCGLFPVNVGGQEPHNEDSNKHYCDNIKGGSGGLLTLEKRLFQLSSMLAMLLVFINGSNILLS